MPIRSLIALSMVGWVVLAACSGPSQSGQRGSATGPDPETPPAENTRSAVTVVQYETFDVSTYPARPPEQTVEVTHQVPRRLMQGRADEGVKQTVEGFRVQVFSAQDQEAAQDFREQVRQWWAAVKADAPDALGEQPPIVIEYAQPYYRVRIGAFAEREQAAEALEFVQKKFSGAFAAQSTVTVTR
ncbi:MAG: SPOR domain-containing protein [Bacteroidetes bacterium SW_9_63_38]|nr:MAG: SPOR domain-containing protein [Bacteroidetes bacterium SW_9_63_38]